jgi:hypothetical protein
MAPISSRKFFVPFSKVDKAKRTVWGIAQSEDVDSQDDLLSFEASVDAFGSWAGNIREQHDNTKAVGKAIDVIADPDTRRITVGAQISLGAEDTWLKVLDGTLTGFSIGGQILESEYVHSDKLDRSIRQVSKYELYELSLVDVPANAHCVITAVEKRGKSLVATDVLGKSLGALTACDVLIITKARKPMKTRTKVKPVQEFIAKAAAENQEFVMVRVEDFEKSKDGNFVLKGSAPMSAVIRKEDFDADGYSDSSDMTSGDDDTDADAGIIDYEGHAENAAKMHKDLCKAAGIEDNESHYLESTDEKPNDDDKDGSMGDDDDDADKSVKSRRARNKKSRLAKSRADKAANAAATALEAQVVALKAEVAELKKSSNGNDAAPRVGSGSADAVLIEKGAAGKPVLEQLKAKLAELQSQKAEFVSKGARNSRSIDADERRQREQLGNEILRVQEQISAVTAASA